MDGVLRLTLACLVVALAGTVRAGEYTERVEAAKSLQPLGEAPFGERIDLHTGEVTFHQTDILLEGTGPAIRIARLRPGNPDPTQAAAFGDWVLDVPRVDTLVADDGGSVGMQWRLNAAQDAESFARCTRFAAPHAGEAGIARAAWWEGVSLHLGDGQAHTVLRRAPEWTPRPEVPGEFPAVTTSHVQIGCLAATRNGEAGEAFLALSPDGLRHRLDWLVGRAAEAVADGTRVQRRTLASMVATRVEDRFGNSVDYVYEDARLRAILASDGRHVEIAWSGDHISHITTHPESDAPRTWQYAYVGAKLAAVVQPDGSRWSFDLQPTGGPIASVLTTPSGLTGAFVFELLASRLVLVERRWSGPGVDARWSVRYGPAQGSAPRDADSGDGTCGDTHWRDVIEPDGARHRHTFSTACGPLEGKRLRTETFDPDGTLLRTEALAYATLTRVGDALRGDAFNASPADTLVPLRERTITQQRSDFRWRVLEHDAFGRAIAVERSGTRTRIDRTTHADSMSAWVLGQVATESFV
ncbi:MAG TPA: hypothetical protein VMS49_01550, partial [Lysobacter sp.]|nr:hypothetical protein [Lysobacter sp.]